MIYTGCDLQIAVFLLLSLFWTKHHSTTKSPPPTTPRTTPPDRHYLHPHKPNLASIASPAILQQRPTSAQNSGGFLTPSAFLHRGIVTFCKIFGETGSRPLFLRPMGERGSAPEVMLIRIFAYPGYKRDINDGSQLVHLWGVFPTSSSLRSSSVSSSRGWGVSYESRDSKFFCQCFLRIKSSESFPTSQAGESSRRILVLGPVAVYTGGGRAFCQVPGRSARCPETTSAGRSIHHSPLRPRASAISLPHKPR